MDGQRLIKINAWGTDSVEYKTETGLDIIRGYDIKLSGPSYFKVYTTGGQILEYGDPNSIASYYPLKKYNEILFYHLGWALIRISDRNGNFVEFNYETDSNTIVIEGGTVNPDEYNSTRISSIVYGNKSQNKDIVGKIDFEYQSNQNPFNSYLGGMSVVNKYILDKIKVTDGSNYMFRKYQMNYNQREANYFLTEITKSSEGESLLPINFEWAEHNYTYEYDDLLVNNLSLDEIKNEFLCVGSGDINGDGITDILAYFDSFGEDDNTTDVYWGVFKSKGNRKFDVIRYKDSAWGSITTFLMLDMDNDGREEVYLGRFVQYPNPENIFEQLYYYRLECYKYYDGYLNREESQDVFLPVGEELNTYEKMFQLKAVAGDFKGTGTAQFLLLSRDNKVESSYGLDGLDLNSIPFGGSPATKMLFGDINGDGKVDIAYLTSNGTKFYTYESATSSFKKMEGFDLEKKKLDYYDHVKIGDFNGDGNTDLLVSNNMIYLSTGKGWIENNLCGIIDFDYSPYPYYSVLDINKDGRSDILINTPSGGNKASLILHLNKGESFEKIILDREAPLNIIDNIKGNLSSTHGIDILVYSTKANPKVQMISKDIWFNKITEITDSFDIKTHIAYKDNETKYSYLTKPEVITSNNGENVQFVNNIPFPIEVVDEAKTINSHISYSFSNPAIHKEGKGFLGFSKTETINENDSLSVVSESLYNTKHQFLFPWKNVTRKISGSLISEQIQHMHCVTNQNNDKLY
ncbi:VCBS repeat-containing protein, partial [Bacteroidales bacterium OttesenSCG-928-I14]|nr:VCBS repeat-containing protein [Bacteroidales bacterium OttesenSCG-928-I14]